MSATPTAPFVPDPVRRVPDDGSQRDAFLAAHPPADFFACVDEVRARRGAWFLRPMPMGLAAAGLALVVLTVSVREPGPGVRAKGTALPRATAAADTSSLGFAIQRADGVLRGSPGLVCHAGDRLRLVATQQEGSYGLAVSVDARGRVEVLHAGADGRSLPLVRGRDVPLPGARELDDYVGPEWYWLVVSERPLSVATVTESARKAVLDSVARGGRPADVALDVGEDARALGFWIDKR